MEHPWFRLEIGKKTCGHTSGHSRALKTSSFQVKFINIQLHNYMSYSFIHSKISIVPLRVHYYSEALPTPARSKRGETPIPMYKQQREYLEINKYYCYYLLLHQ